MEEIKKSLFLCTTPLQARICLEIIKFNKLESYDILYCTLNNTLRDQSYFKELSRNSDNSYYYYCRKKYKGLNTLCSLSFIRKIPSFLKIKKYDVIYIASIDNYLFRYLIKENYKAILMGFDDGTANITPSSSYYNFDRRKRAIIINKLLKIPSPSQVIKFLKNHYTIYPNFKNIVHNDKLIFIKIFKMPEKNTTNEKTITFFIGQPCEYYLDDSEKQLMTKFLSDTKIDYYIMHPKELKPLITNTTVLNETKLLAEDTIIKASKHSKVHVISGYSTVLFNLSNSHVDKTYLSISKDRAELDRCMLIEKTGANILNLS